MNRQQLLFAVIGLLSAIGGSFFYLHFFSAPAILSAEKAGQLAQNARFDVNFSDLVLNDLNRQPRYLQEWDTPLLIVNFWAPWCAPCRREIPDLIDLRQRYSDQLQILGLSFDSLEKVSAFNQQYNINYPLLLVQQEAATINRHFGNTSGALPFTALLNPQREIIYQHHGEIDKAELENQLVHALNALKKRP